MGKNYVVLSFAICLLLSNFHEISCQVDKNKVINPLDEQELQVKKLKDSCDVDSSASIQSEAVSGQCSSLADEIQRPSEVESIGSLQQYESKKGKGGSVTMESIEIGETGAWHCFGETGVKEDEEFPIVLPEYDLEYILEKESTNEGSLSNTSTLKASLSKFVEKNRARERSSSVEHLKRYLTSFRNMKVTELVSRSDWEEILNKAARYEVLTSASKNCIMKLFKYRSELMKAFKASQRIDLSYQRTILLKKVAKEKQKKVDADIESAKALVHEGERLHVKTFAVKEAIEKFETKKEEIEMSIQKIVANISILIDEAALAFEEHRVATLKWDEEVKPFVEYSYDDIESAESDWVGFLNTL